VKHYVTFSSCDAQDYLQRRQSIYGMSYVFPPRYIDRYMGDWVEADRMALRSSMFGGPWILMGRLTEWDALQIELVRREASLYKGLRGLIREGKVFHLSPRPDGARMDALESFHAASNRAVVFVYGPKGQDWAETVYPRGLNPHSTYRVTYYDRSIET